MEHFKISITIEYYEQYIPPRCRKPRLRETRPLRSLVERLSFLAFLVPLFTCRRIVRAKTVDTAYISVCIIGGKPIVCCTLLCNMLYSLFY